MQCRFPTIRFPRQLGVLALLLAACATTGCSKTGKVTGKVTFEGKQVLVGHVTFTGPDGKTNDSVEIEDGVYTLTKVPVGVCKITVDTSKYKPPEGAPQVRPGDVDMSKMPKESQEKMKEKMKQANAAGPDRFLEMQKKYIEIPFLYASLETTTLSTTVKSGTQDYNIEIPKPSGWVPGQKPNIKPPGAGGPGGR